MNKILVITYHYVRNYEKEFPNLKILRFNKFKKQLNFLSKNYKIIDYFELLKALETGKKLPKNACWLTFDDGYIDHYKFVLPELKKRNIKGSFFPVVNSVKRNIILDVNKIQFILSKSKKPEAIYEILKSIILKKLGKKSFENYKKKYFFKNKYDDVKTSFIKKMLQFALPDNIRKNIINVLFKEFVKIDEKAFSKKLYMKKKHLKNMISNGMHIGGHGFNHIRLGLSKKKLQDREINETKKFLKYLGANINDWVMCYPYGNFNNLTKKILKKNNCKIALTVKDGIADLDKMDLLEISRIDTNKIELKNFT